MEVGSIAQFLENKTLLVTGATGFLAKIFVEKILRVQPNVKKLYLLVRAADPKSASQRLHQEIIGKEVFKVLREKLGAKLNSFIADKVTPVPGDMSLENLGVEDSNLKDEICREVEIVVNIAATTNFDERYDVALGLNTMGAKHILEFARQCLNIKMVVHVSTAYVAGERAGLILESPYYMGETLNGTTGLDIDEEMRLVEETLAQLQLEEASDEEIKIAMKDLGIKRAKLYGWPNTYVFTKAMGEMLLGQLRGILPLIIIRPSIITSTYKEPFPGWVEGIRTIDSIAVGYGKGKLTCFLGDPTTVIDAIPADMVVNSMIVAMASNGKRKSEASIYHIGSSVSNPVNYANLQDYGQRFFAANPWINKDGKPVKVGKVKIMSTMDSFHRYMAIHYLLPLKGLQVANAALCQSLRSKYRELDRKISFVMRVVELYRPYLFFKGSFDDTNVESLRIAARETASDSDEFYFDPKTINWDNYFLKTHLPGVVKYILK